VDSRDGAQEIGSLLSLSDAHSGNDDDPGRTYQKPTGDLDKALDDAIGDPSLDDSETDRSRPKKWATPSMSMD
jgi:hypothetical protein